MTTQKSCLLLTAGLCDFVGFVSREPMLIGTQTDATVKVSVGYWAQVRTAHTKQFTLIQYLHYSHKVHFGVTNFEILNPPLSESASFIAHTIFVLLDHPLSGVTFVTQRKSYKRIQSKLHQSKNPATVTLLPGSFPIWKIQNLPLSGTDIQATGGLKWFPAVMLITLESREQHIQVCTAFISTPKHKARATMFCWKDTICFQKHMVHPSEKQVVE